MSSTAVRESVSPRVEAARSAAVALDRAVAERDYTDWDVYDALASPLLERLARTRLQRQIALQLLKRSPLNLRGPLRVPRLEHTKGIALFAAGNARLAALEGDEARARRAVALADRLAARRGPGRAGAGWGYDFPMQTRWGRYAPGEPNAVATAFAAHALMDVAETCDEPRLAELALEAVEYAAAELVVERDSERWFGYYAGSTSAIHNSSLLLASVFARALEPGDPRLEVAADAVRFTIARQRADGSWPYGEEPSLAWVDGFHSAYNLDALDRWHVATGDEDARAAVERGLALYLDRLLDPDGAARATLDRRHPIDVHACATAITTLSRLAASGRGTLERAGEVLDWTLANMRRRDGRFAFQRHRLHRNPVPYVRWGDGHMMVALATYAEAAS